MIEKYPNTTHIQALYLEIKNQALHIIYVAEKFEPIFIVTGS